MDKYDLEFHLLARRYDPSKYQQWYGDNKVTFPLFDFAGRLAGYQAYTPFAPKFAENPHNARYFTRAFGKQLVWGNELEILGNTIFLTEGVFKSAAIHQAGFNSWSILGSNISAALMQQLRLMPYRFICIGDNDKAGKAFSETFTEGIICDNLDEQTPEFIKASLSEYV